MAKLKYSIFHVQGGFGKHIAATAVAKCIKNNHPGRQLIVVSVWSEIFQNLRPRKISDALQHARGGRAGQAG